MADKTHTQWSSKSELHTDAKGFYEGYWNLGTSISETTAQRNEAVITSLFPVRPQGRAILEIGVGGEGGLLYSLKDTNAVHGLDASASGVEGCTRLGVPVSLFDADREAIPFPTDHFDIVFAFEVMEHLSNPQFALDEVRRVLKPGGKFIASTPSVYTHHWPRLFYPGLFLREGFRAFLLGNRFWLEQELGLGENFYTAVLSQPKDRVWSSVWVCENAKADVQRLVALGNYFLEQRDAGGIRLAPIEASDMFRAALALAPGHIEALGGLGIALVYRAMVRETEEITTVIQRLRTELGSQERDVAIAAGFRLVLVHAEMQRFGLRVLADEECEHLIDTVTLAAPDAGGSLRRTLTEARALSAKIGPWNART